MVTLTGVSATFTTMKAGDLTRPRALVLTGRALEGCSKTAEACSRISNDEFCDEFS